MPGRLLLALLLLLAAPALAAGGTVSAADPRAAEAGREMLRAGGSATDAAIATMIALTIVEPQSSGIGGGGFIIRHGAEGITTLDGRETAPAAAAPGRFLAPGGAPMAFADAVPGGLSVGVPGNIRLAALAHARWGRLPWARLFEPAIRLAENGFAITPALHARLAQAKGVLRDFPAARALYLDTAGEPLPVGSVVRNPALAAALGRIARRGPDAFYAGATGRAIRRAVETAPRNPARITARDLAAYRAKERPAVCGAYRDYRVCGIGPPSSGAVAVLQILGLVERFDLAALGPRDPRAWHLLAEAMRLAYADRDTYLADPDFVAVPVAGLIDPGYLAARSALIRPDAILPEASPGTPPGAQARRRAPSGEVPATTHLAAADGEGTLVGWTSTIEGPFGSALMADGFFLNNELTDFSFAPEEGGGPVANRVEPGKRPRSSMSPTIVYGRDGQVMLGLGSAGGPRIIMHVLKTLVGVIDWGLPVEQAIALPNLYFTRNGLLVERGPEGAALRDGLAGIGHVVTLADLPSKVNAIERGDRGWRGIADPRSEGAARDE